MEKIKVLSVFGTRPEAIKMAPLVLELARRDDVESLVCVTAQHREMLDSVMGCFNIKSDYDLNIMEDGQTPESITSRVLASLSPVLREVRPSITLVHGDTTTAFSGALAAFYEKIPVGHVEAGLRTFDKYSPFPEEMNRTLISRLASHHFAPTNLNSVNLKRESVMGDIFVTGNTVIDAMEYTAGSPGGFESAELRGFDFIANPTVLMTCHRRENYGRPMENIFRAVSRLAESFPDLRIIYPVHPSPYVRETAAAILGDVPGVFLIGPLEPHDMHKLMAQCHFIMTDSGGIQEEAPALGKPVLVLRRETERPEAVNAGTVMLAGVRENEVFYLASRLMTDNAMYEAMSKAVNPYGDGQACRRIADAILWSFGRTPNRPEDFKV